MLNEEGPTSIALTDPSNLVSGRKPHQMHKVYHKMMCFSPAPTTTSGVYFSPYRNSDSTRCLRE